MNRYTSSGWGVRLSRRRLWSGTGITSTYKVRATLHLSEDGQTSSAPFLTDVFALDGSLLFSATGTVNRKRVVVEPLP